MRKFRETWMTAALVCAGVLAAVAPVRGDLLTGLTATATPEAGGLTLYSYTLSNLSSSTVAVSAFSVAVSSDSNLTNLTAPSGWEVNYYPGGTTTTLDGSGNPVTQIVPGDTAVSFTSPDPTSINIAAGASGTFSFESPRLPGTQNYAAQGLDFSTFTVAQSNGSIVSPVPEPASFVLMALGGLGLAAAGRARRARTSP